MTHLIKHLSFGQDYPGIVNPLDDTNITAPQGPSVCALGAALRKDANVTAQCLYRLVTFLKRSPFFSSNLRNSSIQSGQKMEMWQM